ncbi:MAG: acetoacetate--CoA ligase [Acidimicrobiales bacterium]
MSDRPSWTPSPDRVAASNLRRFQRFVADRHGVDVGDYASLHRWSVRRSGDFWAAVWDFCEVRGDRGDRLVEPAAELRHTRFLPDATLNVAENLLGEPTDDLAIVFRAEDGEAIDLTRAELHRMVAGVQRLLTDAGVQPGDRVAAWLPNRPETYAVMLAATGLGAVFSSTSPDFGTDGVVDRVGQIEPKVLFAAPDYPYNGRRHDCLERLDRIVERLPGLRRTVLIGDGWLDDGAGDAPTAIELPFDHPWYVLYSSGTTGRPKCIVHRAGGVLLKHLVEHRLHCDVKPGDRIFYYTTAGWMMWNWLASGLANDAAIVVYDGAPSHPDANRLFDLADEVGITLFGTSAKFIDAAGSAGIRPVDTHDLSTVRTITSTGSTLVPEGFDWVYDKVRRDVHLASISGGTDLCGCLVAGDPTAPVHRGEIQAAGLGMDIDVCDRDGTSVEVGGQGELVCRNAFPSMPLRFWDDPGDVRYRAAYFEQIPGVWHHGDFASPAPGGGYVISGRSDATLNPGGVRIGTAEIYRRVDTMDEVAESIVIGQERGGDTRIVLFVRMAEGHELTDEVRDRIRDRIRSELTPRHVPAVIAAVPDIPRTRSGKITELAVRDVVHGREVTNTDALANPEALEHFRGRPELMHRDS